MVVCQERATEEIELKEGPSVSCDGFQCKKNSGPSLLVGRESRNCHSFSDLLVKLFRDRRTIELSVRKLCLNRVFLLSWKNFVKVHRFVSERRELLSC